jgi:hypothetical protein
MPYALPGRRRNWILMNEQQRLARMRTNYKVQGNNPRTFDNKHENKRAFVIGGGPSIDDIKKSGFSFDKLDNEITFGINKAYNLLTPTYLVFSDAYFWKHFMNEIKRVPCYKIVPDNIIRGYKDDTLIFLRRSQTPRDIVPNTLGAPISFINNSGVATLRIAYAMGCNPIYLVGIDVKIGDDGKTHFHNDYSGLRTTPPTRYNQFYTEFDRTIKAMQEKNREIISCSENSLLNKVIPYVPITSLGL